MEVSAHEIEFRQQRLAHLETLKAAGHRPYGRAFERTGSLADVRAAFAEGKVVRLEADDGSLWSPAQSQLHSFPLQCSRVVLFNKDH